MRFSELEFSVKPLRSSAVFGGRLKRPSPCRIRSAPGRDRVRGLSETSKREVRKFLYFGRYTPELFMDLGVCRAPTKKTYQAWGNIYFQVGVISKLASYFVPTTLFPWSHLEAFDLFCTSYDWLLSRCF